MKWPEWWNWELEITPHVEKRMLQRSFNEIELREMLKNAKGYESDIEEGRFKIVTSFKRGNWEIIVEPDYDEKVVVIVTAYFLT
jgi:hypothetical protein